jgi:hypothetical protein
MKAKVKATGKVITVSDNGERFHPRYWGTQQGYDAEELEFLKGKKGAKITTAADMPDFLKGVNWPLLRRQKLTLVKLAGRMGKAESDHLEGIIALVDAIQDYAVDEAGIPSKTVFGRLNK